MKAVTLCADDYSQSAVINIAILKLVEMRRLDAVSCFTLSPSWRWDALDLRAAGCPQTGLHFNLTHPFGQPHRKISSVLGASILGTIDRKSVRAAFEMQWHEFIGRFGAPPDFVDGHQHVHAFPIVRDVIIGCLADLGATCRVRSLRPPPGLSAVPMKQKILERVAAPLAGKLGEADLPTNRYFAGFRPYQKTGGFRQLFRQWTATADDDTLIMCHPGHDSGDPSDPIREFRLEEFNYLSSVSFGADHPA